MCVCVGGWVVCVLCVCARARVCVCMRLCALCAVFVCVFGCMCVCCMCVCLCVCVCVLCVCAYLCLLHACMRVCVCVLYVCVLCVTHAWAGGAQHRRAKGARAAAHACRLACVRALGLAGVRAGCDAQGQRALSREHGGDGFRLSGFGFRISLDLTSRIVHLDAKGD